MVAFWRSGITVLLFVILLAQLPSALLAESRNGRLDAHIDSRFGRALTTHQLQLRLNGVGRVNMRLRRRALSAWRATFVDALGQERIDPTDVELFQGLFVQRSGRRRVAPVAVTRIEDETLTQVLVTFHARTRRGAEVVYRLRLTVRRNGQSLTSPLVRISRVPLRALDRHTCGGELHRLPSAWPRQVSAVADTDGGRRELALATDADRLFYNRYGSRANGEIAAIVNAADAIYRRDLNVRIVLSRQRVFTTTMGLTSNDPETLLSQYRSKIGVRAPGDVSYLFTGREFNGATVGIAYLGVLCVARSYSVGAVQDMSSATNHLILAHELGHNLGAEHDTSTPRSLMYPSLGTSQDSFSSRSVSEIRTHITAYGSCMPLQVAPTPTPTRTPGSGGGGSGGGSPVLPTPSATPTPIPGMVLKVQRVARPNTLLLRVTVLTDGVPTAGVRVGVVQRGTSRPRGSRRFLARKRTNAAGKASFRVSRVGNYRVVLIKSNAAR